MVRVHLRREVTDPKVTRREFPGRVALVSSFGAESVVLLHLAASVDPAIPVIFIDTGRHFPETLAYVDELERLLGGLEEGQAGAVGHLEEGVQHLGGAAGLGDLAGGAALAGRANGALNVLHLGTAFLMQAGIGALVSLWPTKAGGHAPAAAYAAAFGCLIIVQAMAFVWFLVARSGGATQAGRRLAIVEAEFE